MGGKHRTFEEWCKTHDMEHLLSEYSEKNPLSPDMFNADIEAIWKCSVCGSEWTTSTKNRKNGTNCPECWKKRRKDTHHTSRKRPVLCEDTGVIYPSIMDAARACNVTKTAVYNVCIGRQKRVRGFRFSYSELQPLDMNELFGRYGKEYLFDEYDEQKSGIPLDGIYTQNTEVWWNCRFCKKSFRMPVATRVTPTGGGCPHCTYSNKQKRAEKGITFADWCDIHHDAKRLSEYCKDNILKPDEVLAGSLTRIKWQCTDCGHTWMTSVNNRTRNLSNCPKCAAIQRSQHMKGMPKNKSGRPVQCIETGVVYDSINQAGKTLGICATHIAHCCRGARKVAGGLTWRFAEQGET